MMSFGIETGWLTENGMNTGWKGMFEIERKVKSREAFVLVQNLIVYQNNLIVILKREN